MNNEYTILRELGKEIAEIAHLPVQDEKKKLWIRNNDLSPVRPMVHIDQLPWHELNTSGEMRLACEEPFLRSVENTLRQLLYRWKHFPCDMVVENRIDIPRSVHNLDYGIHIKEETRETDASNDIVSHKYEDQIATQEKLDALENDKIWVDTELDERHMSICREIFDGIIPVRFSGVEIHAGFWDRIAQMRPAEAILYDIIDEPEFIEKTAQKFVDLTMSTVDQCERLGLLDPDMQYVHCTGAYTNDLPKTQSEAEPPTSRNVWSYAMAQIFSTISPAMHEQFDLDIAYPLYERFGLLYYGCCEPLENKIEIVKKIKNVRKISISPWANVEKSAGHIGKDYVLSYKFNPALIATGAFEEEPMRLLIKNALGAARKNGCPIEIILKDVSTVGYRLDFLDRWEKIAMEMVQEI